jgi:hypothetical protein
MLTWGGGGGQFRRRGSAGLAMLALAKHSRRTESPAGAVAATVLVTPQPPAVRTAASGCASSAAPAPRGNASSGTQLLSNMMALPS